MRDVDFGEVQHRVGVAAVFFRHRKTGDCEADAVTACATMMARKCSMMLPVPRAPVVQCSRVSGIGIDAEVASCVACPGKLAA